MLVWAGETGVIDASLPPLEQDETLSFRHAATREALACWKSLLNGRAMPSRADLGPKAMAKFLPHLALMELRDKPDGTTDYFTRLAGTAIEQVFGSFTGRFISEFLPADIEARWCFMFDAARKSMGPVRMCGRLGFQRKTWLEAETLIAPLSNGGKTVSMLFVAFASWGAGTMPAR